MANSPNTKSCHSDQLYQRLIRSPRALTPALRQKRRQKWADAQGIRTCEPMSGSRTFYINRAPVLTLWAAVVAERLGFLRDEALTLGRAVAGLNAYSKGISLGLFRPSPKSVKERRERLTRGRRLKVDVLHRAVPVGRTPDGLRALSGGRPISPASVQRYLLGKFGDHLAPARAAMRGLARSMPPKTLAANGYALYVKFRPAVPTGVKGWAQEASSI
jgi:hypothetical protein